jgi:hypothetical protein
MTPAIERKLEDMGAMEPITPDQVDWEIVNPAALNERLGHILPYFQRVETEATVAPLITMLPNSPDGYFERGVRIWSSQEQPHGELARQLRLHLGHDAPVVPDPEVPIHNRAIGFLTKNVTSLHEVFELVANITATMHERLVIRGYKAEDEILVDMHEFGLSKTYTRRVLPQEGMHGSYFGLVAETLIARLKPWQKAMARGIVFRTYAPVGAGSKEDKADFGEVALTLVGDDVNQLVVPIHETAVRLVGEGHPVPQFVLKAITECIEAAKAREFELPEAA